MTNDESLRPFSFHSSFVILTFHAAHFRLHVPPPASLSPPLSHPPPADKSPSTSVWRTFLPPREWLSNPSAIRSLRSAGAGAAISNGGRKHRRFRKRARERPVPSI